MEPITVHMPHSHAHSCVVNFELTMELRDAIQKAVDFLHENKDQPTVTILLTIRR